MFLHLRYRELGYLSSWHVIALEREFGDLQSSNGYAAVALLSPRPPQCWSEQQQTRLGSFPDLQQKGSISVSPHK